MEILITFPFLYFSEAPYLGKILFSIAAKPLGTDMCPVSRESGSLHPVLSEDMQDSVPCHLCF
jgi:hypothetical protein